MHTPTQSQSHLPFTPDHDAGRINPPAIRPKHAEQSKQLYFDLSSAHLTRQALEHAQNYLQQKLQTVGKMDAEIPSDPAQLLGWIRNNAHQVGVQYEEYLQQRKAGGPRRYFSNKSHALNFLQSIAPTKLVDGSWLYGLVQQWRDQRFAALIRIYLEELGAGMPQKNHVVLYKKLLATHGCEQWQALSDEHFVQGAIQLALAHHADQFLPEVIGFNLGYEQLPLHLLVTAYELNELDIDPYYFTLHITVDNASTGHAQKAAQGVLELLPQFGGSADYADFYRRMVNGYKLNMLGAGSTSIIAAFDLDAEIIKVLSEKSVVGKRMHSDFCRIGGRTVNEWLRDPAQIPQFLLNLQQNGWIKRHQDPRQSRFWRLLEGDRAEMFGVFSPYEKQVIYDWIADADEDAPRPLTFRARQRLMRTLEPLVDEASGEHADADAGDNAFNADMQALEAQLALPRSKDETMKILSALMSPTKHHTPPGLMATRMFTWMLDEKSH